MDDQNHGWNLSQARYFKRKKDDLKPERDARHAQRETLYIAGPDENTSTIISYNPSQRVDAKLASCTYTAPKVALLPNPAAPGSECILSEIPLVIDDIDMRRDLLDMWDLSRIIVSRFMSYDGRRRAVRLVCDEPDGIMSIAYSVLLVSNILPLICSVISRTGDTLGSPYPAQQSLMFVLTIGELSANTPSTTQLFQPNNKNNNNFYTNLSSTAGTCSSEIEKRVIREIIENTIIKHKTTTISSTTGVYNEEVMCSIFWAIGVTNEEYLNLAGPGDPPVGFRITTDDTGAVQVIAVLVEGVKVPVNMRSVLKIGSSMIAQTQLYIEKLLRFPGAAIEFEVVSGQGRWETLAARMTRVFMGGYADIYLRVIAADQESVLFESSDESSSVWLAPVIMAVSECFRVCVSVVGPGLILIARKSSTCDPFTRREASKIDVDASNIPSGVQIAHSVIEKMVEAKCAITARVARASSVQRDIFSTLLRLPPTSLLIEFSSDQNSSRDFRTLRFDAPATSGAYDAIQESFAALGKQPSDVSPSNYRCADVTVRFGGDDELGVLETKLRDSDAVSVLLIGPRGIAAGIRTMGADPMLEFISERAVKDPLFGNLKNAVRLFVRKSHPLPDWQRLISETVSFPETDSRVTVANRLFSALSAAALAGVAPFVLLRADSDHCVFVGAMAVVVANGWSRSVQARVETRVVLQSQSIYFITRLITVA